MKRVAITGINRGLGKELFNQFISNNYFVYGILRNKIEFEKLNPGLPENSKLIFADLQSDDSIDAIRKSIGDHPIDLLINNAGIGGKEFNIENIETQEISNLFNIHCLGVVRTVKAVKKNLLKSENPIVINLNSRFGSIARQDSGVYQDLPVTYSYRIAKASQNMLTVCLRTEFKEKIQFVSLHPGKIKTEIAQVDADAEPRDVARKILESFETDKFKNESGIVELGKEIIEW